MFDDDGTARKGREAEGRSGSTDFNSSSEADGWEAWNVHAEDLGGAQRGRDDGQEGSVMEQHNCEASERRCRGSQHQSRPTTVIHLTHALRLLRHWLYPTAMFFPTAPQAYAQSPSLHPHSSSTTSTLSCPSQSHPDPEPVLPSPPTSLICATHTPIVARFSAATRSVSLRAVRTAREATRAYLFHLYYKSQSSGVESR